MTLVSSILPGAFDSVDKRALWRVMERDAIPWNIRLIKAFISVHPATDLCVCGTDRLFRSRKLCLQLRKLRNFLIKQFYSACNFLIIFFLINQLEIDFRFYFIHLCHILINQLEYRWISELLRFNIFHPHTT